MKTKLLALLAFSLVVFSSLVSAQQAGQPYTVKTTTGDEFSIAQLTFQQAAFLQANPTAAYNPATRNFETADAIYDSNAEQIQSKKVPAAGTIPIIVIPSPTAPPAYISDVVAIDQDIAALENEIVGTEQDLQAGRIDDDLEDYYEERLDGLYDDLKAARAERQQQYNQLDSAQQVTYWSQREADAQANLNAVNAQLDNPAASLTPAERTDLQRQSARHASQVAEARNQRRYAERNAFQRVGIIFQNFMQGYNEYSGWQAWGSLAFGQDWVAERRAEIEQIFCDTIILGGTGCWSSRLCAELAFEDHHGDTVLVSNTPQGGARNAATIQAEKGLPVDYPGPGGQIYTKRLYKVTYFIQNPLQERLRYNIQLFGPQRNFVAFPVWHVLEPGQGEGATGTAPVLFWSNHDYERICLKFDPRILDSNWQSVNDLCTHIPSYAGAATAPYAPPPTDPDATPTTTTTTTGNGGTTPPPSGPVDWQGT